MARRTRPPRRTASWNWSIITGSALCALSIVVVLVLLALRPEPTQRDPVTRCPVAGPSALTVVVIDTTDRLGRTSQDDVRRRLDDLVRLTRSNEKILVYETVAADFQASSAPHLPIVEICNPGNPEDVTIWTGNPDIARARLRPFIERLARTFEDLTDREPASVSPLMETIQTISINVLVRREYATLPKQLVLVSDLLQNSYHLTLYGHSLNYADFASTTGADALRTDLLNVDVRILFVQRAEHSAFDSTRRLTDFWGSWLTQQRAGPVTVTRLEGLN